jgi:hypothetical protein
MTTLEEKNAAAVDAAIAQKARLAELRRKAAESKQAQGDSTTSTTTTTTTQPVITGPSESERLAQRREEQQMNDIARAMEYYDSSDTKYYRVGTDTIYRKDYLPLYGVVTRSGVHAQWWLTDAVLDYELNRIVHSDPLKATRSVAVATSLQYGNPDSFDLHTKYLFSHTATTLLVPIMAYNAQSGTTHDHYTLLIVRDKRAWYFDPAHDRSSTGRDSNAYATARTITAALIAAGLATANGNTDSITYLEGFKQKHHWECGYFVLLLAAYVSRTPGAPLPNNTVWWHNAVALLTEANAVDLARTMAATIATTGEQADFGSDNEYARLSKKSHDELIEEIYRQRKVINETVELVERTFEQTELGQPPRVGTTTAVSQAELERLRRQVREKDAELTQANITLGETITQQEEATRQMRAEYEAKALIAQQRNARVVQRKNQRIQKLLIDIDTLKIELQSDWSRTTLDLTQYGSEAEKTFTEDALVQSGDMGTLVTQRAIESSLQASATRGSHSMTIRIDENEGVASAAQEITVPHVKMAKDRQSQTKVYAVNFDDKTQRSTINTSPLRNETIYASGRMHVTVNDSANQPVKEASFTYDINAQDAQGNYVLRSANGLRLYLNNLGQGTFRLKMIALEA